MGQKQGQYDWSTVERNLDYIASRKHQAILRFQEAEPGKKTSVTDFIKALPNYKETQAKIEGKDTDLPDWSNQEYQRFFLEFYQNLAKEYDGDHRLAFLEVGFGLWAEYHIHDGPELIGNTFPSFDFQTKFFQHLAKLFQIFSWIAFFRERKGCCWRTYT